MCRIKINNSVIQLVRTNKERQDVDQVERTTMVQTITRTHGQHIRNPRPVRTTNHIAGNPSRCGNKHIRGHKTNQDNQETIRAASRFMIRAAAPDSVVLQGPHQDHRNCSCHVKRRSSRSHSLHWQLRHASSRRRRHIASRGRPDGHHLRFHRLRRRNRDDRGDAIRVGQTRVLDFLRDAGLKFVLALRLLHLFDFFRTSARTGTFSSSASSGIVTVIWTSTTCERRRSESVSLLCSATLNVTVTYLASTPSCSIKDSLTAFLALSSSMNAETFPET